MERALLCLGGVSAETARVGLEDPLPGRSTHKAAKGEVGPSPQGPGPGRAWAPSHRGGWAPPTSVLRGRSDQSQVLPPSHQSHLTLTTLSQSRWDVKGVDTDPFSPQKVHPENPLGATFYNFHVPFTAVQ